MHARLLLQRGPFVLETVEVSTHLKIDQLQPILDSFGHKVIDFLKYGLVLHQVEMLEREIVERLLQRRLESIPYLISGKDVVVELGVEYHILCEIHPPVPISVF